MLQGVLYYRWDRSEQWFCRHCEADCRQPKPVHEEVFNADLKPMNAVKMTRRDLNEELTTSQMNRPYATITHLGNLWWASCFLGVGWWSSFWGLQVCKGEGLDFVETLCAKGVFNAKALSSPDYLKVASRDLTNLPPACNNGRNKDSYHSQQVWPKEELDDAWTWLHTTYNDIYSSLCISVSYTSW